MDFWGSEFIYRGRSSTEFGVEMYDFGRGSQSEYKFTSVGRSSDDSTTRRYSVFHYGLVNNTPHTFTLTFGPTLDRYDSRTPFDRFEIEKIASWLTGWQEYDWLYIAQPDMNGFRYRCIISDLSIIYQGQEPWAFSATVTCDSPFGYTREETFEYQIQGTTGLYFYNRSSYNGYYKPTFEIQFASGENSLTIENETDGGRLFSLTPPTPGLTVTVDNQNEIITDKTNGLNLYPYFNFNFLRLVRGTNNLRVTTTGTLTFVCSFPVNIGG